MKPYEKYKDSGVEWIGKVPEHWEVKRLKYVADNLNYKRIPLSSEQRSGIEKIYDYYGASGVIDQVDNFLFDGDFILVGEDGANLLTRSVPLAFKASGKFWVNNHAHILQPKNGNIEFFTYYLESIDYSIWISGSAQPKLTSENLMNIHGCFPPLPEQTAIARYLDQKTTEIDQLIAQKERLLALWEEEKIAVINQAVTRGLDVGAKMKNSGVAWLGEVPEHWEVKRLKYVAKKIQTGSTPPSNTEGYFAEDVNWFTPGDFSTDLSLKDSKRKVSELAVKDEVVKIFPPFSTLMVGIGATLGKVGYIKNEASANQQINAISFVNLEQTKFYTLFFHVNQSNVASLTNAATLAILNQSQTKDLIVPTPPETEIVAIVRHIETQTARIQTQMDQTRKLIELLREYRATLISEVVTGKVKITA